MKVITKNCLTFEFSHFLEDNITSTFKFKIELMKLKLMRFLIGKDEDDCGDIPYHSYLNFGSFSVYH